ncbi:MAG: mechanosensitive ion channel [Gemmatimonadota bacterium]|jgi:small conductance mechanosensitive channel|nr:mechanosensitive ion channel [Gemmatimonadota bacterium]
MIQSPSTSDSLLVGVVSRWPATLTWNALAETALRIVPPLVLAWLAYRALGMLLRRIERSVGEGDGVTISLQEQRARTLVGLARNVGIVVIAVITLFMVLQALGVQIGPLLAGAGVVGLAVSFGAQSLVKDIISGLFILFENQFGVGDVIRVREVSGRVERMTLRVVVLRDVHGVVHVMPNGEITLVSNLTRSWSRAVLDIGVAYKEDADEVMEVMREVGASLWDDPQWRPLLTEEITVPGIESFGDSAVNIRIMATTVPLKQWEVARELRRRLKRRFDADGIEIPFPHRTFYWGDKQLPPAFAGPPAETGSDAEPRSDSPR